MRAALSETQSSILFDKLQSCKGKEKTSQKALQSKQLKEKGEAKRDTDLSSARFRLTGMNISQNKTLAKST